MITYTYKCKECEIVFEAKQKMSDDPLKECPECQTESLEKVIESGGGFRIGGMGVFKPTTHWGG